MAHSLIQPTLDAGTKLEVLKSGSVTGVADLITPSRDGWQRNTDSYQTLGSSEANSRGDGRVIIGVRTVVILITPEGSESIYERLYDFEQAVADATHLRWGSVTLELVGKASLVSPSFHGEASVQATLRYTPRYAQALSGATPVLGPL